MPFPVSGQRLRPAGEALPVQTPSSTADAEACRLATAVGRGNEAAFRELYDRYNGRLFRFALVLSQGDESLACETVQSVFVTAATKLHRVESEEHLWNWLARVARQQLSKALRRRQRDSNLVSAGDLPECAEAREPESLLEESLDIALLSLEPSDRQLIEWYYFDGLGHLAIAEKLASTPKAVSSRLERARARLRAMLKQKLSNET